MAEMQALKLSTITETTQVSGMTLSSSVPVDTKEGVGAQEQWKQCLLSLEKELPWQTLQTWFLPIIPVSYNDQILTVRVPSRFFYEWLESHHGKLLKRIISQIFGESSKIKFAIAPSSDEKAEASEPLKESPKDAAVGVSATELKFFEEFSAINHSYRFASFVVGQENKLVCRAAEYVSKHPGQNGYNPLFVYGRPGTGKTHLLHALGNSILEKQRDLVPLMLLVSSERFLHDYVYSLQNGHLAKFISSMTRAKMFLLDDIQFLANKVKSQEGLLFIFSELFKRGAQVVINSNVSPEKLSNFNTRLISFFQKGLIVDLATGEYATREKIIRAHLKNNSLHLDEKIIHFLAENLNQSMHHLNAMMVRIVAQMSLLGKGLSFNEVRHIVSQMCPQVDVGDLTSPQPQNLMIEDIVRATAHFFEVPMDVLQGVSRKRKVSKARQAAIYLCRELTSESLNNIGYHFSNLHHASVLYACNKVKKMLEKSPTLKSNIQKIKAQL